MYGKRTFLEIDQNEMSGQSSFPVDIIKIML